jgi:phospholipid-binding lipoprotein MlaA
MKRRDAILALILTLSSHAAARAQTPDLWPDFSRSMHAFNMRVAKMWRQNILDYREAHSPFVHRRILNFTRNLDEPSTIVNSAIELDLANALASAGRFVINSTIGIFGLFDPAGELGLKRDKRNFGLSLGAWGAPEAGYFELPIMGPATSRGAVGTIVDNIFNPLYLIAPWEAILFASITGGVMEFYEGYDLIFAMDEGAIDSYETFKTAYLQNLRKRLDSIALFPGSASSEQYDFDMEEE